MALFFMMTRYARDQDKALIKPIMDHFDWLASHPDNISPNMQSICTRLKKSWVLVLNSDQIDSDSTHYLH